MKKLRAKRRVQVYQLRTYFESLRCVYVTEAAEFSVSRGSQRVHNLTQIYATSPNTWDWQVEAVWTRLLEAVLVYSPTNPPSSLETHGQFLLFAFAFAPFFLNFGQTFGSRHTISTPSQDPAIIFRLRL